MRPSVEITGIFMWTRRDRNAVDCASAGDTKTLLQHSAFYDTGRRPKWWQFRRRYQLLRRIEGLGDGQIVIRKDNEEKEYHEFRQ